MERLAFIISRVRVFIFLLLVFLWQTAESQRIVTGEYFFDTDPGLGNGTVFTVNSSGDSVSMNFDIPAGSLSCGGHYLYYRFKDSTGTWGHTASRAFSVFDASGTHSKHIVQGEYFFDTDPGQGNGIAFTVTPDDSADLNLMVPVSGLSEGTHKLYYRFLNSGYVFGLPQYRVFRIIDSGGPNSKKIIAGEYFIDTDPGLTQGVSVGNFTAADSVSLTIDISTANYSVGKHYVYSRFMDSDSIWGHTRRDTFTITPCTTPVAAFSVTDNCVNMPVAFNDLSQGTTGTTVYRWDFFNDGSLTDTTRGSVSKTFNTSGNFTAKLVLDNGPGCKDSVTVNYTVYALPSVNFASLSAVCVDAQPFALSGGSPSGGTYSGTGVSGGMFSPSTAGSGTHTLTYVYTDANGCTGSATQTQVVNALPVLSLAGFDTSYCSNSLPDTLTPTPAGGNFTGAGMNGNIFNPAAVNPGIVNITYYFTDANGCFNSINKSTTVHSLYNPVISGLDSAYCLNDGAGVITADTPGVNFSGNGITGNSFDPSAAGVGSHTITYTYTDAYGCTSTNQQLVTVYGLPQVSLTGLDTAYCKNSPADTLTGLPAGGVFTGALTGGIFNPAVVQAGVYHYVYYSYTDSLNCTAVDSAATYIRDLPQSALISDTVVCEDQSLTLTASQTPATSFLWNTGAVTNQITVDTSIATIGANEFAVTITDTVYGCSTTDSVEITFEEYPVITIADTINACGYSPILVEANSNQSYTYLWSTGETTSSIWIDSSMTHGNFVKFSVTVNSPAGCTESKDFWVKFRPPSYVNLGRDTSICINNSVVLKAGSGYDYLWSTGDTTQFITVYGDSTGTGMFNYSVTVTRFGCSDSDDVNVMVNPCTGIPAETQTPELVISPNPSDGRFVLTVRNISGPLFYEIYGITGRVVKRGKLGNATTGGRHKFDLRSIPKGVYQIRIYNRNLSENRKIIID